MIIVAFVCFGIAAYVIASSFIPFGSPKGMVRVYAAMWPMEKRVCAVILFLMGAWYLHQADIHSPRRKK
jgi:hypothetical protein